MLDAASAQEELALLLALREEKAGVWDPLDGTFVEQREFIIDAEKRKTARCTRRAGKTISATRYLSRELVGTPDCICVYVALTRLLAKRLIWNELQSLNARHGLGWKFNHSELTVRAPNGSEIWLIGMDDEAQIEKLRGPKYKLVIIDEAGSFPEYLRKLVDEVISPALMDCRGTLVLMGTPGAKMWTRGPDGKPRKTLFHEATTDGAGWSRHRWSVLDNPYMPHAREEIETEKQRRGWTEQSPGFLREYRGEWVSDEGELVYHYDPAINDFEELPRGDWNYILSLDVGFRDRTAFIISAYAEHDPAWYVEHAEAKPGMIPSAIAARIKELRDTYKPVAMVMDCGALGLAMAEEFRQKHGLPVEAADKREKLAAIEFLNGDLRRGLVKVRSDSPLVEEWRTLQYDDKGKEDPHQRNDVADAALYGYRRARHYLARPKEAEPDAKKFERMVEDSIRRKYDEPADADFSDWGM